MVSELFLFADVLVLILITLLRFGPSLPHDSILAVFEFYGMSESWLAFFEKWLNASMLFEGASGPRTRSRGVPIAHALSVSRWLSNCFARSRPHL